MNFWKRKKNNNEFIPISLLINEFRELVIESQDKLDNYHLQRLQRFYNPDGSPIVKMIQQSNGSTREIPLLSLVNPQKLGMKELSLNMDLSIDSFGIEKLKQLSAEEKEHGVLLEISNSKENGDLVSIKLKYEIAELLKNT